MKQITRHLRVGTVLTLAVLLGGFPVFASAATASVLPNLSLAYPTVPDILITELQTNGGSNAAQEFIELYNATDHDITFGDGTTSDHAWKLQTFKTPTGGAAQTWLTPANTIELKGTISSHEYYTASPTGYAPGGIDLAGQGQYGTASSNFFIDSGGAVQLVEIPDSAKKQDVVVHDQLQWLPKPAAGAALPLGIQLVPAGGKSIQRVPNDDMEYINSDGTVMDFGLADASTPLKPWLAPLPVEPVPTTDPDLGGSEDVTDPETEPTPALTGDPVDNTGLAAPRITELLPNPASPLTDAADEFIELYNPNTAPFDLKGYSLEVGTTTLHKFTFTNDVVIPAGGYAAFFSIDTKLSLTNSGGQARLLGPAGLAVSETMPYGAAADNASWSQVDGLWQWTSTATPNAINLLTVAPVVAKTTATKASAAKVATVKKATATKAKGTTTTKKAAAKKTTKKAAKKKATKKTTTLATAAVTKPKPPIHTGILVAVAVAAVLYGLYEYRHDISDKFRQLRGNRGNRRQPRSQTAWRRDYSPQ